MVGIARGGYQGVPMPASGAELLRELRLPDRYRPVRLIAHGGMASVWCAEDDRLHRRVAIKVLAPRFLDNDRAVRRFQREARAAARLSGHPHVVSIFDVGIADEVPFIVMEHLPGGTVADAHRVGAVSREQALRWVREAARGLDHAHAQGVVHRDIKPANLLLDRDQRLRVADFGIARLGIEDTLTGTRTVLGTAAYISPEQALGRPATGASDRYSLAVVAYELLVGERPFTSDSVAAVARQHVEQPPPRPSEFNRNLTPAIDEVLGAGLAKQPERRFDSAAAFASALARASVRRPDRPAPTPAPTLIRPGAARLGPAPSRPAPTRTRHSRRRNLALTLAALALVAFVLGAASGAHSSSPQSRPRSTPRHTVTHRHAAPAADSPTLVRSSTLPAAPAKPAAPSHPTTPATSPQPPAPASPAGPAGLLKKLWRFRHGHHHQGPGPPGQPSYY
jgi:eukaryotic-like serine/threonine-protein kinase